MLEKNIGKYTNRIVIGTPTMGTIRMEWVNGRYGQTIPTNWSHVDVQQWMSPYMPLGYQVADAENLIAKVVVEGNFEWYCFPGETLIETKDSGERPIKYIEVGDMVKTHTGEFHEVTKKFVTPIKQRDPMCWIHTANHTIKSTPNHPYYVRRKGKKDSFIPATKVRVGDTLLYPIDDQQDELPFNITLNTMEVGYNNLIGSHRNTTKLGVIPVTDELARYLGLYLAEGHAVKDGIAFTFNNNEIELHDLISEVSRKLFDRDVHRAPTKWPCQLRLKITNLSTLFIKWFGKGAKQKRVPEFVFGWNLKNRLAFLDAYLQGDGTNSSGGSTFTSASQALVDDVSRLAHSCGLRVSNTMRNENKGGVIKETNQLIKGGPIWSARISTLSRRKMLDLMAGDIQSGYIEIPVVANEAHKWAASLLDNNVYNITVEGDNSYIAQSVAVHNCSYEDDNIPSAGALVKLNEYMIKGDIPMVAGLYFTKSVPPEPMIYRERGYGYYADWKLGDKVWARGIPFGFTLIHGNIIREIWKDAPEYNCNGTITRRVFDTPADTQIDPETGGWIANSGTSDLEFCNRIIEKGYLAKAGFPEIQKKKYPFLVDTSIFVEHIDDKGVRYPISLPKPFFDGKITYREALKIMTA